MALAFIYCAEGAGAVGDVEMSSGPPWPPELTAEGLWPKISADWRALFMEHAETILRAAGVILPSTGEIQ